MNQQKLDSFIAEYLETQEVIRQQYLDKLRYELLPTFWEKNPSIGGIIWRQYTTYHNDGDECIFGVSEILYSNATDKEDYTEIDCWEYYEDKPDIWAHNIYYLPKIAGIDLDSIKLFESFIRQLEDVNVLQQIFGLDSQIIITRNDLLIEDYSDKHD